MKAHLTKLDASGLSFAREALEAADIEFEVRDDSPGSRYSPATGRMAEQAAMFDIFVEEDRLADAKSVVERWQEDAEEAALRESGAPPPTAEELAADAEWEKEKVSDERKRTLPVWPGVAILAALGGAIVWLLVTH
jgi:hypothetical protein